MLVKELILNNRKNKNWKMTDVGYVKDGKRTILLFKHRQVLKMLESKEVKYWYTLNLKILKVIIYLKI